MIAPLLIVFVLAQPVAGAPAWTPAQLRVHLDADNVQAEAERRRRERERLNHATWAFVATAGADWSVSLVCDRVRCGDEHQHGLFLRGLRPKAGVPIGLAIDGAIAYAVREHVAPDHPRIALAILYGLSAARIVLTSLRVDYLRRNAVRRPGAR